METDFLNETGLKTMNSVSTILVYIDRSVNITTSDDSWKLDIMFIYIIFCLNKK